MENRKLVKLLIPISILGFFIFNNLALAYNIGTHTYLTDEAVKFYNLNYSENEISKELIPYLLDGSRQEDNNPRYLNHFYDPVNNRGLENSTLGNWQISKDWAQDEEEQNKLIYKVPTLIASILTAIQQKSISSITSETNFTWQRAIRFYVNNEKEKAMFALGHILHLIQDTSVPDHTRNDSHAFGSPYEKYAEQFSISNPDNQLTQRLNNKNLIILNSLDSYFDELAKYSNNNFYSEDTIGIQSGYNLPKVDLTNYEIINGLPFLLNEDPEKNKYILATKKSFKNNIITTEFDISINNEIVRKSYWSLLSVKAVQYSAGIIDLFFKEVEIAKNNPDFLKTEEKPILNKIVDSFKNFLSQTVETTKNLTNQIGDFISGIFKKDENFQLVEKVILTDEYQEILDSDKPTVLDYSQKENINLNDKSQTSEIKKDEQKTENHNNKEENKKEIEQEKEFDLSTDIKECSFKTSQSPSRQKLIINEIAWMGTNNNQNDEWIELKNISGNKIDLSNWQLIDKDEQININLSFINRSKIINPNEFILLERTDDNSAPNVSADLIYTGILSNSNEGLRLFDNQCNLVDEVLANPDWPAGENNTKKTMERNATNFGWHTSSIVNGTPKMKNSAPETPFIETEPPIIYGGGISGETEENIQYPKILINEIQTSPLEKRFIELYNPNNSSIDLTNWYIQRKAQNGNSFNSLVSKSYFEGKSIPAKDYFLISREEIENSDIVLNNLTLTESNTIQIKNPKGETVDKLGWGETNDCEENCALNPNENQSIQRKFQNNDFIDTNNNFNDFEIQNCPSPKAQFKDCSIINQKPSVFFNFYPSSPKIGDLIVFDSSSSTDIDGQINSYKWDFGDNTTSSISTATTTHIYSKAGNYLINLTVFDNNNASSSVSKTINISSPVSTQETNHIVISEIMAGNGINHSEEEFIELYNPTNETLSLSGWSLKRKISQNSTSTINLVNKFSTSSEIAAKSFFLIAHSDYLNYSTSTLPDIFYTNQSSALAYKDDTIILYDNDEKIIDEIFYQEIEKSKSIERKSFYNNFCFTALDEGEFLGNGCDTDNENDFELRNIPNPQNLKSLPEPRNAPAKPENFVVQYDNNSMKFNFEWTHSPDFNNLNLFYEITESSSTLFAKTASNTIQIANNEVGKNFNFSIKAVDKDGLGSSSDTTSISVPSFLSDLYFYQDSRDENKVLIEAYYNEYPFIPDLFSQDKWQLVVFYLNKEAKKTIMINNSPWEPEDIIDILTIEYKHCSGALNSENSLIIPITQTYCSTSGGAYSQALKFSELEDNHLIIHAEKSNDELNLNENDFLTIAFYATCGTQTMDGRIPSFKLVAVDKTEYYFNNIPIQEPPQINGEIDINFNPDNSSIVLNWPKAIDTDTLDYLLNYEVRYNPSEEWINIGNTTSTSKMVSPGDNFSINIRAKDDFGNYSSNLTTRWTYPETIFYINQTETNNWSDNFGYKDGYSSAYLTLQSIVPQNDFNFNKIVLKIKQIEPYNNSANLKLSIYTDNGNNSPNFENQIANAIISNVYRLNGENDSAFTFNSPVSVLNNNKYWLLLEIDDYNATNTYNAWRSNKWQNAINTNNPYLYGESGRAQKNSDGIYKSVNLNSSNDWYMKIGKLVD
ncbi:lamin tail domain-containing protein [Candidatus Wolfebacteria bacterium]|nr:lamin tail domain-containing protein [Candidatus Wolfebacteria bacterium]